MPQRWFAGFALDDVERRQKGLQLHLTQALLLRLGLLVALLALEARGETIGLGDDPIAHVVLAGGVMANSDCLHSCAVHACWPACALPCCREQRVVAPQRVAMGVAALALRKNGAFRAAKIPPCVGIGFG